MLNELKRRIGDEEKADLFLADAKAMAEAYTGIRICEKDESELALPIRQAIIRLAVILYNREGIEGEAVRSEGGVSRTMEALPLEVELMLKPYRLAKVIS